MGRARIAQALVGGGALLACAGALQAAPAPSARDFTGTWAIVERQTAVRTAEGESPPMQPWALEIYNRDVAARGRGDLAFDPVAACLPPGAPRVLFAARPFQLVHAGDEIVQLFEYHHQIRRIGLRAEHPRDLKPTFMGDAIARWDGDVLVIETTAMSTETRLDQAGIPHSDDLRVTERLRLVDADTLENEFTFVDPKAFTRPWKTTMRYRRRLGYRFAEDICRGR